MASHWREQVKTERKPLAVIISDVHYTLATINEASLSMNQATDLANKLNVPLIVSGDIHDTKANMRGECMNRMLKDTGKTYQPTMIMVGNHDKINEKGPEHSLGFLSRAGYSEGGHVFVIDKPFWGMHTLWLPTNLYFLPYYSDVRELRKELGKIQKGAIVIMHQGLKESGQTNMIDPTAITLEDVAGLTVISGHYHNREHIVNPHGGTWDFVGNPYTFSFGEANDRAKGMQILYDDGSLQFSPTNLRRHVILEFSTSDIPEYLQGREDDILWIKIHGTIEQLSALTRKTVATALGLTQPFKLDLIPTQTATIPRRGITNTERFDSIIDGLDATAERKQGLKELWRKMLS